MANVIWNAAPRPTNAAEIWEWPMAMYAGPQGKHAAYIICKEPCSERGMNNGPVTAKLQVIVLNYSKNQQNPGRMLCKDREFPRIEHAMAFVQTFLETHKSWQPLTI